MANLKYLAIVFQVFLLSKGHITFAKLLEVPQISSEAAAAFEFLDSMLQPASGCNNKEYAVTDMGRAGTS